MDSGVLRACNAFVVQAVLSRCCGLKGLACTHSLFASRD